MSTTLDILAFGAHPDDVEIGAGGTMIAMKQKGNTTGVMDLTMGELGTRGNAELRMEESRNASYLLGLSVRENLQMADGFFENSKKNLLIVIQKIRQYKPRIVLANSVSDRHPDHGRASKLVSDACFYSGLVKVCTSVDSMPQAPHRPTAVYHYLQDYYLKPDFVFDITAQWEKKAEALRCFSSQFYDPNSTEPDTPISNKHFLSFLQSRAMDMGRPAGFTYAEGFIAGRTVGTNDLFQLL